MASLKFVYRPSSKGSDYCGSLCLRLIHLRKAKMVTMPYKVFASEWNATLQKIVSRGVGRTAYLREIQEYLDFNQQLFDQIVTELELQGPYTVEEVYRYYCMRMDKGNLLSYVDKLAHDLIKNGQERTARAYYTVSQGIIKFNKGKDLPLAHINSFLIKDYERDMKAKGKSLNTISFYMRNLRAICNKAVQDGMMEPKRENPFQTVFTGFNKTRKRALSVDEIGKLHKTNFSRLLDGDKKMNDYDPDLYKSWRFFFFCFHARGMSFVDLAYLRKSCVRGNIISYYRKKTGQLIEVKITPTLRRIMMSFEPEVRNSDYIFPVIIDSNKSPRLQYESGLRMQNKRLKELAAMVGIRQALSTHVSRHSWATIAKKENLPLWVISEGLGHSSEKTTYTYLASFERSMLDHANDVIGAALDKTLDQRRSYMDR